MTRKSIIFFASETVFQRIVMASFIATLVVWIFWVVVNPVNVRIAKAALMHWIIPGTLCLAIFNCSGWVLCRWRSISLRYFPIFAGMLAFLVGMLCEWWLPASLPLPTYGFVSAVVGAGILSRLGSASKI